MSGDQLSVRLFLFGVAISCAAQAMSAAGWKDPLLIDGLFVSAVAAFLLAVFWRLAARKIGFVTRFATYLDSSIGLKAIVWGMCIVAFFPAIYFTVQEAQRQSQQVASNGSANKNQPEILTGTPIEKAYKGDFENYLRVFEAIQFNGNHDESKLIGNRQVVYDFDGNSKFLAIYIPATDLTYYICVGISGNIPKLLSKGMVASIKRQDEGNMNIFKSSDMKFSGAIYLYVESGLDIEQMAALIKMFKEHGATVRFRDYSNTKG